MRKVIITESQFLYLLKETGYPLNTADGANTPGNIYGTQVGVNNLDKDAKDNATTGDKIMTHKAKKYFYARSKGMCESEFDDNRAQNFGKNEKSNIISTANNGGGKMIKNLANDIQNNGSRYDTDLVRKKRLKDQKKSDPITFAENGGQQTLNALESSTRKESNKHKYVTPNNIQNNPLNQIPNQNKGTNKGHHSENEGNIYYY